MLLNAAVRYRDHSRPVIEAKVTFRTGSIGQAPKRGKLGSPPGEEKTMHASASVDLWAHARRRLIVSVCAVGAALALAVVMRPGVASAQTPSCPWATSQAPIAQRVAQLMGSMTVAQEDFLVEGHGTTNEGPN